MLFHFTLKCSEISFNILTLNTVENLFRKKMEEIYNYSDKDCDDEEMEDMYRVSHLLKVRSEIFTETFKKEKTDSIRESIVKSLKMIQSIVDIDNTSISLLEGMNWIEFNNEKLVEEIVKL